LDNEPVLSYRDWLNNQTLFCFKAPQNYTLVNNMTNQIIVRMTVDDGGTPANYRIHAVVVTENQLKISGNRNKISVMEVNQKLA